MILKCTSKYCIIVPTLGKLVTPFPFPYNCCVVFTSFSYIPHITLALGITTRSHWQPHALTISIVVFKHNFRRPALNLVNVGVVINIDMNKDVHIFMHFNTLLMYSCMKYWPVIILKLKILALDLWMMMMTLQKNASFRPFRLHIIINHCVMTFLTFKVLMILHLRNGYKEKKHHPKSGHLFCFWII